MAGMVPYAGQPLNHGRHPREGAQLGAEALGACSLAQGPLHLL